VAGRDISAIGAGVDRHHRVDHHDQMTAFLRREVDSDRVLAGIDIKRDLERVVYCPGTLLWSARLSALGRTAMVKLSARSVYQVMTVRNANTTTRVFALMQQMQTVQQPSE
jgi:uncharacterized protein (DUF1697 family)